MSNPSQAPDVAVRKSWPQSESSPITTQMPEKTVRRLRPNPPRRSPDDPTGEAADVRRQPLLKAGRRGAKPRVRREDPVDVGPLPTLGVLLMRPLLFVAALMGGALIGLLLTANGTYKADAVLEFSAPGSDSGLTKQIGQTLARKAVASDVVQSAEAASGTTGSKLGDRATVKWVTDSQLVVVSVTAATPDGAMREANALAQAVVTSSASDTRTQLNSALNEFNANLKDQSLDNPQAETARRSQLGASFATRQDAITSQSGKVAVLDAASVAGPAGLTRPMGIVVGATLGLMVAALTSALLGVRGLRVQSTWALRYLFSDWRTASPSQAAEIAGRIIESQKNAVAFIATDGTTQGTESFAADVKDCLEAHGRTVRTVDLMGMSRDPASLKLLRHDVRQEVDQGLSSDLVLYTVIADSKAAALLQGQSNLRALIIARRRRTRVEPVLRAMKAFSPARPLLILVR